MKTYYAIFGVFAILLNVMSFNSEHRINSQSLHPTISLQRAGQDEELKEKLIHTTVQIQMSVPMSDGSDKKIVASGLGSMIWNGSQYLLVTHNHWGAVLQDLTLVEFYDANHRLLMMIFGEEFHRLVTYQDAGTLVIKAPQELSQLANSSAKTSTYSNNGADSNKVKPGDIVFVVYRQPDNHQKLNTIEAEVESIIQYKTLPAFKLRSLNGQPIVKGDSGGGIWYNGRLVGNLWVTITKEASPDPAVSAGSTGGTEYVPTDISFGAVFSQ